MSSIISSNKVLQNSLILFFCFTIAAVAGCSSKKKSKFGKFPYVPETTDPPSLSFYWDRTLDSSNVNWLGAYGVWEGAGNRPEIATEVEIHLDHPGEPIYAMTEGVVVYIQPSESDPEHEVEGVWVRYGHNYMLKYVHVSSPAVSAGDRVYRGMFIGRVANFVGNGFWEVELRLRSGDKVYTDCIFDYLDPAAKATFQRLWDDQNIRRSAGPPAPYSAWRAGGWIDMDGKDNPDLW